MKRKICLILVICLFISICACRRKVPLPSGSADVNNNGNITTTNGTQTQIDSELIAASVPTVTENTTAEDGTILFQYTYQNMSLVLHKPQVADKIILDFLNRIDGTKAVAQSTAELAKNAYSAGDDWIPYLYHITYSPMRIDNKVLSLFGNNVVYNGAGHPERTCVSVSYDLSSGDILTLASIMNKDVTVQQFLDLVQAGLAEMAEGDYLYENYKDIVYNRFFDTDPAHDEYWYFTQTGLCFYFAPYEIAPYSSGVITVEIPYEKLTALIHKDYLPQKRTETSGSPSVTLFEKVDLNQFDHIAEIVANNEGSMYMLQTDNIIQDVRIITSDKYSNYTIFAAYNLSPKNGIMVQADEALLMRMKLSYQSGGKVITENLMS